jgi:hypothetical protein
MLRAETPISHPILLSVSLGNSYTGSARPRPFHRDRHSPGFGFSDGGDRRGTRLIGVDSFFRRSKPYRARASSPFDVVCPGQTRNLLKPVLFFHTDLSETPDVDSEHIARNASGAAPLAPNMP